MCIYYKLYNLFTVIFYLLQFLGLFACGLTSPDHVRLVDDLLRSYRKAQKQCRPVLYVIIANLTVSADVTTFFRIRYRN